MTLNKQKGFLRLTIVLSIITSIGYFIYIWGMNALNSPIEIPLVLIVGAVPARIIYLFVKYIIIEFIVNGFKK